MAVDSPRAHRALLTIALLVALAVGSVPQVPDRGAVADRVQRLTRESSWRLVGSIPIKFRTYHPQGMVKVGDIFFVSSVEVKVPTRRFDAPVDGRDRDTGQGTGHLFKIDRDGRLLRDLVLGEGPMYHPGGIDFDGSDIWVPVAEYRPDSRSIVFRVNPRTLEITEVLRVADHIGAVALDTDDRTLHGVSWGSRRFYSWKLDKGRIAAPAPAPIFNPSHYVDYQDCKYAGAHRMVCTGVTEIREAADRPPFRLGGLELVDLRDGRPLHQVPVLLWTHSGFDMTHNPSWLEASSSGLRAYFMPEDDTSTLYVYEVN